MQLRQGLSTAYRQAGIGLPAHAHDPQRGHRDRQPEPLGTLRIGHLGLMPLPSSPFGIFKSPFDPTAHSIPCCRGWLRGQIGHDQPDLLVPFIPSRKQCTPPSALLFAETVAASHTTGFPESERPMRDSEMPVPSKGEHCLAC